MNENLSQQFLAATDIEAQQRRKKARRGLAGAYVGIGGSWMKYPDMTCAMGTGGMSTTHENLETPAQETAEQHGEEAMGSATNGVVDTAMPAPTSDGGGMGGTMTGMSGTPA